MALRFEFKSALQFSIVVFGLSVGVPSWAEDRLTLTVSPTVSLSPADIEIETRVQPHSDNRLLEVVAESTDFFRSSELPLNGESAPRITSIKFHGLPAGDYFVTATLKAANRTIAVEKRFLHVASE